MASDPTAAHLDEDERRPVPFDPWERLFEEEFEPAVLPASRPPRETPARARPGALRSR